jgi:Family of unknown function (DUF6069)
VHVYDFAIDVLIPALVATALAAALARFARHPTLVFTWVTGALAVVSLAGPLTASHTTEAIRLLLLALGHVIAAVVVIPDPDRRPSDQGSPGHKLTFRFHVTDVTTADG